MSGNTIRLAFVIGGVAIVALSGFAMPVAAQQDCAEGCFKDPGNQPPTVITPEPGENFPDSTFDEHFPDSTFDEHFPDSTFDEHFPDSTFDEHFPDSTFDENHPHGDEFKPRGPGIFSTSTDD